MLATFPSHLTLFIGVKGDEHWNYLHPACSLSDALNTKTYQTLHLAACPIWSKFFYELSCCFWNTLLCCCRTDRCLSGCMCVCVCVCLSFCLSVCLYARPSVCLSVCLPVRLSVFLPVCLSVCMSVRLSVFLSVCMAVNPSVCLSVCMSVFLSVCLYVYLSVHVKWTPVTRNSDIRMWHLMMPNNYTTLRSVLLRFWAKYILFCNKNNALRMYVRLTGSSPGTKCLFTLRSEWSAHGITKGLPFVALSVASQNARNSMPPAGGPTGGLDGNLPSHLRTDGV